MGRQNSNSYFMKKLSKLVLKNQEELDFLSVNEQKSLLGGAPYSGTTVCAWSSGSYSEEGDKGCTLNLVEAEFMGTYWWCCNCKEALDNCSYLLH